MGEITDEEAAKLYAEQKARFEAVPADLRRAILSVLKQHDSDDFHVGNDDEHLADFLDDLTEKGLEIRWRKANG